MITDDLSWIGECPYGGGSIADVWRGTHRGTTVAVKVLRVNSKMDLVRLDRVRPFVSVMPGQYVAYTDENGVEILLRSSLVETTQASQPVTIGRGEKISTKADDDF